MRNLLLLVALGGVAWQVGAVTYYPAMYEKATGSIADTSVVSAPASSAQITATEAPQVTESVTTSSDSTAQQVKEQWVAATLPMRVTSEYYTAGNTGVRITQTYHVVVGSFANEVNARRMAEGLRAAGANAQVAMSSKGTYRVFLFSGDDEREVRMQLARSRAKYPDAWILKIKQ